MTSDEYLLVCLMEEAAEVTKLASKALRFGLWDRPPDGSRKTTNGEEIAHELADLIGVVEMLTAHGCIPGVAKDRVTQKRVKVARFMQYSRERGTLTSP